MNSSSAILAVLVSLAFLGTVSSGKKKSSPPKWKSTSMPGENARFLTKLEGDNIKLDCRAQGHPKPGIRWMKDGVPIRSNAPKMITKKFGLLLDNVTADMSGNYTCLLNNKHGSLEWTFIMDVQATVWPLIVDGPKNITQMVGANVAFQCRILNDPKATVRWQRVSIKAGSKRPRDQFLPDGDDPQVLLIEDVQLEHAGEYRCMAGNIMGLKYSSAWLSVLEPVATTAPPPIWDFDNNDNDNNKDMNNLDRDGMDSFGIPYEPYDPNPNTNFIENNQNTFFTTTRRPRNKNKGRGKNGRKKNKKNKKNNSKSIPKTRPPPPPTTTTSTHFPTESSTSWVWTDYESTSSTPTTFDFYDWQQPSTYGTDIVWTDSDDDTEINGGAPDTRYNPDRTGEEFGKVGSAKESDKQQNDKDIDGIEEWKIYTIVGAVGGVVLLIGLIAITIAVCCPKQEGAVYKATPV